MYVYIYIYIHIYICIYIKYQLAALGSRLTADISGIPGPSKTNLKRIINSGFCSTQSPNLTSFVLLSQAKRRTIPELVLRLGLALGTHRARELSNDF